MRLLLIEWIHLCENVIPILSVLGNVKFASNEWDVDQKLIR